MGIYLTGDTHSKVERLAVWSFTEQKDFSGNKEDNYVIILGDFGLIWDKKEESSYENYWLNWLEEKPFTTLFLDGNHENFNRINEYPIHEWKGGKIHQIRPHIMHLMRGQVFTIEDKKFFTFGGASSHDIKDGILDPEEFNSAIDFRKIIKQWDRECKMYRIKNSSWWEQELPTKEEMAEGRINLEANNNKVDYILSHSPSTSELYLMGGKGLYEPDILTNYLDDIKAAVEYKRHYFGHMHINKAINDKDICLYEQIIRIN